MVHVKFANSNRKTIYFHGLFEGETFHKLNEKIVMHDSFTL